MGIRDRGRRGTSLKGKNEEYGLRILNAIRRMISAVDTDSRRLASEHDITGPQLMCLLAVVDQEQITSADVARRIHLDPSTLVGVLDRLEGKGLVHRDRSEEDRRRVYISSTEEGRKLAARIPYPLQHTLETGLNRLPVRKRKQMAACLEGLARLADTEQGGDGPLPENDSAVRRVRAP